MTSAVIVSDIRIYCDGLALMLKNAETFERVEECLNHHEAIAVVNFLKPDIVLVDMAMLQGYQVVKYLRDNFPDTRIIALALAEDDHCIVSCVEAGIAGYILRDSSLDDLLNAIREVLKGRLYCPERIASNIIDLLQRFINTPSKVETHSQQSSSHQPSPNLTRREVQIADLMASGLSNKQIAQNLCIEVSTVKNHVHSILVKMGVENRTHAAFMMKNLSQSNPQ